MGLVISEQFVNLDRNYRFGGTEPYETFTEKCGELFKHFQREYGRCTSSIYVDTPNGTKRIGWVFQKRVQYEDSENYYTREVWITLH